MATSRCAAVVAVLFVGPWVASAGAAELTAGAHWRSFDLEGHRRTWLIHVPKNYDPATPTPVVLVLHSAGTNALIMAGITRINQVADRETFLAVYPEGIGAGLLSKSFNAGGINAPWAKDLPNDVLFIARVLDQLSSEANIDGKRVYATGLSNGAMMCYRLADELSDRVAAIAAVAGTATSDPRANGRAVPILHLHGDADKIVPYDGPGPTTPRFITFHSVERTIDRWRRRNGCPQRPEEVATIDASDDRTQVIRSRWAPRDTSGAAVELYKIVGGGHTWPGHPPPLGIGGVTTREIDANEVIWEFFSRHSLP